MPRSSFRLYPTPPHTRIRQTLNIHPSKVSRRLDLLHHAHVRAFVVYEAQWLKFFHTSQDIEMIDSLTETSNVFVYLDSIVEVLTLVSSAAVTYALGNTRDPCMSAAWRNAKMPYK